MNIVYVCIAIFIAWLLIELLLLKCQQRRTRSNKVVSPKGRPITFR